jgi:hypothetical protein
MGAPAIVITARGLLQAQNRPIKDLNNKWTDSVMGLELTHVQGYYLKMLGRLIFGTARQLVEKHPAILDLMASLANGQWQRSPQR